MARKDAKIAEEARLCAEKWRSYFTTNIDQYHDLHNFVLGRQWSDDEEDMLKTYKKVPLQFNKLATLVNTVLGEQQQNTPQIEIMPMSGCDQETVEIRQTVTKNIMLSSDAKTVYQVAGAQAFIGGFGAFVIDTDYVHETSFNQDIVYRHVKDATKCYWDIGAQHINKIDGMFCGELCRMSRQKFRTLYGDNLDEEIMKDFGVHQSKAEIALATQPNDSTQPFTWADNEGITIIRHYKRRYTKDTLFLLSNGESLDSAQMEALRESSKAHVEEMQRQQANQMMQQLLAPMQQPMDQGMQPPMAMEGQMPMQGNEQPPMPMDDSMMMPQMGGMEEEQMPQIGAMSPNMMEAEILYYEGEPVRILETKEIKRSKIDLYKIAGDYILEETESAADDLSVIFVDQNSYYDERGKQICRSLVIDAIDTQRYINYLGTQSAYLLKISRYDQFMASKKNVQSNDTARQWRDPTNVKGALTYDESPSGNKPEQLRPPELPVSLTQQYERAINDLYTSTGLYPTRLGQEGPETSGRAIDARTRQGSYPTYVAFNSINRAITAGGTIVNQMIPRVYDTERVMNLMTPDRGRQNIVVNQRLDPYGERIKNNLRKGEFRVILQAGPSYEGQKTQALDSLNMVLATNPTLFPVIADLYAENLPLTNTIEITNRLKTLVSPQIIEAGKTGKMPQEAQQPSPQDQAAMADVQFKKEQIELQKKKLQLEMEAQEAKLKQVEMELQMKALEMAATVEDAKLRYMAETDRTRSQNAIAHADNLTKLLTHKAEESHGRQSATK